MSYRKLIMMLSSDNDNEVVAAVRAIDRKLKKDGKDWGYIAERVDGADPMFDIGAAMARDTEHDDVKKYRGWIIDIMASRDFLSGRMLTSDRVFIFDMKRRLDLNEQ